MRPWIVSTPGKPPVVLVTGGASGIGWAIAKRFAAFGALVEIADIDQRRGAERASELGVGHRFSLVDLSDSTAAESMVHRCFAHFGRIDVLINNAGRTSGSGEHLGEQGRDVFDAIVALNVEASLRAAEAAARLMADNDGGAICNIASGAALRAVPFRSAYSPSKAAIMAATRVLAEKWAKRNVRVNVIAPGQVRTELLESLIKSGKLRLEDSLARIPMGRLGEPDEVAAAALFLGSDAGRRISGAVLSVDGGSSAYGGSGRASRSLGIVAGEPPAGRPVVLLHGGANELGKAIAKHVVAHDADVCILDSSADRLARVRDAVGAGVTTIPDGQDDLCSRVQSVAGRFGRIDAVVNLRAEAAGGGLSAGAGLGAVHELVRAIGPVLLKQGYGSLLNLAYGLRRDPSGDRDPQEMAVEAGVEMMSRSLACEWGGAGLTVNTLSVETPHDDLPAAMEGVVEAAVFLVSRDASFVSGAVLHVGSPAVGPRDLSIA